MPHGNQKVADETLRAVFRDSDDPVLTAKEVSESVPLTRQMVLERLAQLCGDGDLNRKNTGRDVVFWLTGD